MYVSTEKAAEAEVVFREHGGLLRTSEALALGIHRRTLYYLRDTGEPDDFFSVDVSDDDGSSWVNVELLGNTAADRANSWTARSVVLDGVISFTDTVRIRFGASDGSNGGNYIEAAIDNVEVFASN